jgi:hypothetical protein
VVVDCFDGTLLEYFKQTTGLTAEPPVPPTRTIVEIIESIWQNKDREYNTRCLSKRLQRIDKEMSGNARNEFAAYVPAGDVAAFAKELATRLHKEFTSTMDLLRNKGFQDLLVNYERKPRVFFIAEGVQDTVESAWLVRGQDGTEYKPDDYLTAFTTFVHEHENDISAIAILLSRQGVKANVVFLQKGQPTDEVWIFDARSNVPGITKKDRPLTREHFREFEVCYGSDPNGRSKRKTSDQKEDSDDSPSPTSKHENTNSISPGSKTKHSKRMGICRSHRIWHQRR